MSWIVNAWEEILDWIPVLVAVAGLAATVGTIAWVLMTKKNQSSAIAWCLFIIFLPFVGAIFFFLFGYQHVNRPLKRKRRHKQSYRLPPYPPGFVSASGKFRAATSTAGAAAVPSGAPERADGASIAEGLARLADRFGAYPLTLGNHVDFYHDGEPAFAAMLAAMENARHHIHVEFFIFHADDIGSRVLDLLTRKARQRVEIRLLYDAMGSHRLRRRHLRQLHLAGGKTSVFLPLNIFRRRLQINMRNHRKIVVVDGDVAFTGGLNVGDEYLCKHPRFGYWRDTHLRLQGPAVADLQRVFAEDWDFAAGERLSDDQPTDRRYFHPKEVDGAYAVQIIDSGPDRDVKPIRDIYFAAILKARRRLWIASPYFVPDAGLLDALTLAGQLGVDVRLLGQLYPDKWIPQLAARYYWDTVLQAGVKVYQYAKGMMHAKVMLVDGEWASVGTANLDNRSLNLNFEVNCLLYHPAAVAELEQAFLQDLADSIRLDAEVYARRPVAARFLENACRLLSPVL